MNTLQVAKQATKAGGEVISKFFREGCELRGKQDADGATEQSHNLVSDADIQSEQAISEVIRSAFPDHALLGEEELQADIDSEHLWIIDPLDGTNNFAHQVPHFAVSIAYYERGVAQCGVIYEPVRDQWYEASRGAGAFHNGDRVTVNSCQSLSEVLVAVGFYYDRGEMMQATLNAVGDMFRQQIHGIRRMGTAALDLIAVGLGCYGAFFEFELSPWDFAAGRLFVEEAGGLVTTCKGDPLPLTKSSILATNGQVHTAALEVIQPHLLE